MSLFFELLGGVASEAGAILQPMAGVNYGISKNVDFQIGIGKIKSLKGTLDTAVLDMG